MESARGECGDKIFLSPSSLVISALSDSKHLFEERSTKGDTFYAAL